MRKLFTSMLFTFALALASYGASVHVAADAQEKKEPEKISAAEIEKLIQQLGSPNGKTREKASKALLNIGEPALPFVKTALKSKDLESRARAAMIHARITEQVTFARAQTYGFDALAERIVRNRKNLSEDDWKLLIRFEQQIRKDGRRKGGKGEPEWIPYFRPDTIHPYIEYPLKIANEIRDKSGQGVLGGKRVISGSDVDVLACAGCFLLASGDVETATISESIVFANGNLKAAVVAYSIVICGGDMHVGTVTNSILIAKGSVVFRDKQGRRLGNNVVILDKNRNPKDPLRRFFSPASLAVQLEFGSERVRLSGLKSDSPFAKPGLEQGDAISAINGTKFKSEIEFQRMLRQTVASGEGIFEIERAKKNLKIKVLFPW